MNRLQQTLATTLLSLPLMALPVMARAHSVATHTSPANGAVLTVAPAEFQITLNEAARLTRLTLQKMGDKAPQDIGPLPTGNVQYIAVPAPKLGPGSYVLRYRTLSGDSHIMPGAVKFTIAAGAKAATAGK